MRPLIAIDPGTEQSARLWYAGRGPAKMAIERNEDVLAWLRDQPRGDATLAIEGVSAYGMPVGREVFETCVWSGRFIEAFGGEWRYVYRRDVKLYLCNSARAKDANVRQALIDRYGGSRQAAIGRKSQPGPLYGIKSHLWSALGVAVTAASAETSR